MSDKILLVDDDRNLLAACERTFGRRFQLETAEGAEAGLAKVADHGPYAVVVADRQMPGMDGIQFLATVRQCAPNTIRMMLTGNADLEAAIRVVNEGNIFRFLTKPCPAQVLEKALADALAQYRLVMAEKELLNKTLNGSVKLLTDILSITEPQSFGRTQTLRDAITGLAGKAGLDNAWELHLAVMLAPIGYVTIPPETLVKSRAGQRLSGAEEQMLASVPETAARLLANIPRLEGVARIVRFQDKHFDGSGLPDDNLAGEAIPLGARLLKILVDWMQLQNRGLSQAAAVKDMQGHVGWYDPALLSLVRAWAVGGAAKTAAGPAPSVSVALKELKAGMVLRSNVQTRDGTLVLTAGHQLSEMTLEKLRNFDRLAGIKEPILVEGEQPPEVGD